MGGQIYIIDLLVQKLDGSPCASQVNEKISAAWVPKEVLMHPVENLLADLKLSP